MKQKKKLMIKLLISICFISFFSCSNIERKNIVTKYLPQLENYSLDQIKVKEVYADPAYQKPYNIYIRFKIENIQKKNVINTLSLKQQSEVDTNKLRSLTTFPEYNLYFKIRSINAVRFTSLNDEEKTINWWHKESFSNDAQIFATSFLDNGNKRTTVDFTNRKNGRVVCCILGEYCYLLIECWG